MIKIINEKKITETSQTSFYNKKYNKKRTKGRFIVSRDDEISEIMIKLGFLAINVNKNKRKKENRITFITNYVLMEKLKKEVSTENFDKLEYTDTLFFI